MKIAFFGDSLTAGFPGVAYFDILKEKLPQHTLLNYGRGGDSVLSLYARIQKTGVDPDIELGFLWIGVNDVFVKVSPAYPVIRKLQKQPWARSLSEFSEQYQQLLELLSVQIAYLVTVPPLFVGEKVNNRWNQELAAQADIIEKRSADYQNVTFLDIRNPFISRLPPQGVSSYVVRNALHVVSDAVFLNRPDRVNRVAESRGLYFTLDGVHLNERGAGLAADLFCEEVRRFEGGVEEG